MLTGEGRKSRVSLRFVCRRLSEAVYNNAKQISVCWLSSIDVQGINFVVHMIDCGLLTLVGYDLLESCSKREQQNGSTVSLCCQLVCEVLIHIMESDSPATVTRGAGKLNGDSDDSNDDQSLLMRYHQSQIHGVIFDIILDHDEIATSAAVALFEKVCFSIVRTLSSSLGSN